MSDDAGLEEILDVLEAAGLAETYLDDDGHEAMRLTDEGATLAQELGIFEHGPGADEAEPARAPDAPPATAPLDMAGSWGTAVGAAMLGFEQALRSEPPPEVVAGEHVPERGYSGVDDGVVIHFPDPAERKHR